MSKMKPWAKWPLPETVDPTGRLCFVIRVPDDPHHLAAFRGAMLNLASAYKWDDDEAHTAKDVAVVWRQVIDDMSECQVFDVRTDPTNPCILQKFDPDLSVWVDFANIADCASAETSTNNPPGQSQPGANSNGPTPGPNQCYDYDLELQANGVVLVPVAVHAGYTITVSRSHGAINMTGNALLPWFCPNGQEFALGECVGTPFTDSGDPLPSRNHGVIIMQLPDGSYTDMPDDVSYTVPNTMPDGNYVLQVNDSDIGNNLGSYTFHLKVCNNTPCVNITYLLGATGPASVCVGDEFDYTVSVFDGSVWNGGMTFDQCVAMTLVSQSGAIVTSADHIDCAHVGSGGFIIVNILKLGTNSSIGAFTLHFRLDAVG